MSNCIFYGAVTKFRQELCHRIYEFADQDLSKLCL
jgi:hypothetical protein